MHICCRSLRGSVDWNSLQESGGESDPSRSLRGSVDWNKNVLFLIYTILCRSLRGSVDWNNQFHDYHPTFCGRSLRGSVDWNLCNLCAHMLPLVAPFAGAWIEIIAGNIIFGVCCVAPFAGAWIEMIRTRLEDLRLQSLPSRERGLKLLCSKKSSW